jgi:hypothetical protein
MIGKPAVAIVGSRIGCTFVAVVALCGVASGQSTTFSFSGHGILAVPTAAVTVGDFTLNLAAGGPAGALLYESGGTPALGVGPDGDNFDFNVVGGTSEYVEFSLNRPGILTGLNFDGVKDESLEYFILETAGNLRINFFDSAANVTIPGAVDNAVAHGVVTGDVVYLLETTAFDDEVIDLAIPFAAGQVFKLAYAEVGGGLGVQFEPIEVPNGSRLQSLTVAWVPEPPSMLLFAIGAVASWAMRLRRQFRR